MKPTSNEITNESERAKRPNYLNLSVKEQKTLQELRPRGNIVITVADKDARL